VPFHLGIGLGLFVGFADDSVVERDTGNDEVVARPVDTAVNADLVASIGLFGWAELALHLPVHLVYDGDVTGVGGTMAAAARGIGDVRITPKVELWGAGSVARHLVIGAAMPVGLPTGSEQDLRGAGGLSLHPKLLVLARLDRIGIRANLGYLWRAEEPAGVAWSDELAASAALSYALSPGMLDIIGELHGGTYLSDADGPSVPLEAFGGLAWQPAQSWRVYGGAGLGVTSAIGAPDVRVLLGVRYVGSVPRDDGFGDSDGDGIADRRDHCPHDPEDMDGFEDDDGCAEPDNDGDGVPDERDECPEVPEERGGDGDGCPEKTYVKIENGELVVFGKVQFKTGSAQIEQKSLPLVDQLAVAIRAHPAVKKVRIEGHTDDVGSDTVNRELSKKRAESVKDALVERGVSKGRLEAVGHGESQPIAPNRTRAGRAKNRRVEFVIVD
jgi:OmpA-OmpF porin, OOP family